MKDSLACHLKQSGNDFLLIICHKVKTPPGCQVYILAGQWSPSTNGSHQMIIILMIDEQYH